MSAVDAVGAAVAEGAAVKTVSGGGRNAANAAGVVVAVVVVAAVADLAVVVDASSPRRQTSRITTHVRFWRKRLLRHLQSVQHLHQLRRRRRPTPVSPSGQR